MKQIGNHKKMSPLQGIVGILPSVFSPLQIQM